MGLARYGSTTRAPVAAHRTLAPFGVLVVVGMAALALTRMQVIDQRHPPLRTLSRTRANRVKPSTVQREQECARGQGAARPSALSPPSMPASHALHFHLHA